MGITVKNVLETNDLVAAATDVADAAGLSGDQVVQLFGLPVELCSRRVARGDFIWSRAGVPLRIRLSSKHGGLRNLHTFAHELAHAIDCILRGTTDHGPSWRAIAELLGVDTARYKSARAA